MCKETLHPTQRNKRIFSLVESMVALADWKRASENVSLPFSTDAPSRSDSASSRPLAAKISSCTWTRQGDVDFCNGSIALLPQEATWLEVPSLYKAPALLRPNCSNFHGITRPALGLQRLPIFWKPATSPCCLIKVGIRSLAATTGFVFRHWLRFPRPLGGRPRSQHRCHKSQAATLAPTHWRPKVLTQIIA